MRKTRIVLLSLFAVMAISAVASASASALPAVWFVNGAELAAGKTEALAETTEVLKGYDLLFHKSEIEILCSSIDLVGGLITGPKTGDVALIDFLGCVVDKPTKCKLTNGEINVKPVLFELEGESNAAKIDFKPETGTAFAEFELANNGAESCGVLSGLYVVKGLTVATIQAPETPALAKGLLSSEKPSTTLTVAGEGVQEFFGEVDIDLVSDFNWSVI